MGTRVRVLNGAEPLVDWSPCPSHAPLANTKATATQAAPAPDRRNVLTGFVVTLCGGTSAPAAAVVTVGVIDGASGGTSFLWGPIRLSVPAVAGAPGGIARADLWLPGSPGTAMTIEFSGAAGADTFESVVIEGTTIAK